MGEEIYRTQQRMKRNLMALHILKIFSFQNLKNLQILKGNCNDVHDKEENKAKTE